MNSAADKSAVTKAILASWVASLLFIGAYYFYVPTPTGLPVFTVWAAAMMIPTLCLIIGVGLAARHRHRVSHIDGSAPDANSHLALILSYNQNTLEQIIIFGGTAALALALMPEMAAKLLTGMSIWFGLMRLAFYQGYKRRPVLRGFGFAGTFHPSLALFLGSFASLFLRHF